MPRTILIVDDIATNRRILSGMLSQDYKVLEAESGEMALDALARAEAPISAVLLDISMPGMDGYEVLRRMRDNAEMMQIPVIMITGTEDDEARVKSLSAGANDFVMKPYKSDVIKHCLETNIALHESFAIIQSMQRDKLTGLYNREPFFQRVQEMVQAHEPGYYVMACFDVYNFKVINDQYGRQKGDDVLRHIASVFMKNFTSHGGVCCRITADNFAVLYPLSFQDTMEIDDIRRQAAHIEGLAMPIIFSIGRYTVDDLSLPPTTMYDRANLAANSVKGRYDSKIAQYNESMRDRLLREQDIVLEMGAALKDRQFEIWFQPQYNHSTDAMIGAEALVRWRHPTKGLIPPGEFIPLFEQNGFIYSMDQFVWEEVCRYQRKWLDEGRRPLPVSVNVSRYDIFCPDVIDVITGLIDAYGIPAELLRLEITESAFSESTQQIIDVVKALIDRGFTVEIDDFGSGYSSLNTLKDVPAQIIKLDMKFLQRSSDTQRGGNIVESIVRMAKWLGMSVIAEGVETLEQANYLRSIGCSYMQGYLFARPLPASKYEEHCAGTQKEEHLLTLETVENLNNNSFWDPDSIDTLIFNSYVGGACIFEYHNGRIELLRATQKYARVIGSAGMTVEDALKLNWSEHLEEDQLRQVVADMERSIATKDEVIGEYVFLDLPGCPHKTHLRSTLRVIASAGNRYLVYCTNENITAQREAELREREVAQEMSLIMANVNSGICATVHEPGGDFRVLFANDRFYGMYGYERGQMESELGSVLGVVHPDDRDRTVAVVDRLMKTGGQATCEYRCVKRDGSMITVSCSNTVVSFPGVSDTVLLAVMSDVTERVESEQRMRSMAEQIQSMMDDMPGGYARLRLHPDGSVKPDYINEGFCRLVGMSHDEVMRVYENNSLAGVHPDDIPAIRKALADLDRESSSIHLRCRLLRSGGDYLWMNTTCRITEDAQGNVYVNSYYTDASEQIKDEERQMALMDNLPSGAGMYELENGEMRLVYQNKSYWELVGLNDAQFPDPAPMSAIHPDDIPVIMQELNLAIQQNRDVSCDIQLRHLTLGYRPVHLAGRIVPSDANKFTIYATFSPISGEGVSYQQMLPLLLSAIMESTTDLAFAKDTSLRYLSASRAYARMVGMENEKDIIGKTDYDLFDKEIADAIRRNDIALLADGNAVIDVLEQIPSVNGVPRYASTSKYILRDSLSNVVGIYAVGRDVTYTMAQETRLSLVADTIPGGLASYACTFGDFSPEHIKIVYFNDGFCGLFGMTREEYEERSFTNPASLVFEEDYHLLVEQWLSLMEHDTPINCLYRVHVKGGGYKWISHKAVAADRSGGTVIVNAILQDVTEQREMIEQLRISEEENNLAVALGENIIARFIMADRTLTLAPEVAAAYSLPQTIHDVPQEPIRLGLITPETADAYANFFESLMRGSRSASAVFMQKYLGDWRWMEIKGSTVFADSGEPVKAVISFTDVTDRLEKETIYKKWQQSLKDKPPESYSLFRVNLNVNTSYATVEGTLLTFDFDNAGATFNERARAYARQCIHEDDRERYLEFVNSDTMLAEYYRGHRTDMLDYRELVPEGGVRWLRLMVDLVEYPNSTDVEAYLMFENIDAAKTAELQTKELSETDPLTGLLNRTTFIARAEQIIRSSQPDACHAMLMIDVDNFKMINDAFGHGVGDRTLIDVANILRAIVRRDDLVARIGGDEFIVFLNDIRHESTALAKAEQICAAARKAFSMEVQTSVSIGIVIAPREGRDFQTLYKKADSALYYVKGSGKDHHVLYRDDMADEHLELETDADSPPVKRTEKKRRMLIVDDNAVIHVLLQNIFKDDFIIEKARDGNTALIRLQHYGSAISVVLLDLMMPGIDGFDVLEQMQKSEVMRSIPVLIVSSDESRESCLKAIRKGATDFITKPIDADILRVRVHSAVSKAENERLRAKNSLLEVQNEERERFETAIDSAGITFMELNWLKGEFLYYPSISKYLCGTYDDRPFWQILLADMVADTQTVKRMQQLVHSVAESHERNDGMAVVTLKTPDKAPHRFRMSVRKVPDGHTPTRRLMIALNDLDYTENG